MTRNLALRRKFRALIDAIAEPLIADLIAKVEAEVRARFDAVLAPLPVARAPKVRTKKQRAKLVKAIRKVDEQRAKSPLVVHRDIKPAKSPPKRVDEIRAPSPKVVQSRPCGCGLRGRHRATCTGATKATTKRTTRIPSAPHVAAQRERTPAQQRRDEILARTAASRAALG